MAEANLRNTIAERAAQRRFSIKFQNYAMREKLLNAPNTQPARKDGRSPPNR